MNEKRGDGRPRSGTPAKQRYAPPTAAVFGAGIAGLTAAHELVERGFRVVVYEPAPPRPDGRVCEIGGMARTQWSRVLPSMLERSRDSDEPIMQETEPLLPHEVHARFNAPIRVALDDGGALADTGELDALAQAIAPFWGDGGPTPSGRRTRIEALRILGYGAFEGREPPTRVADETTSPDDREDLRIALAVREHLKQCLGEPSDARFEMRGMGVGRATEPCWTPAQRRYVLVQPIEDLVPGEHGFRFFPSFYRHVFDTLLRIPLREPGNAFVETRYTVADNIVPTFQQGLAFEARDDDPGRRGGEQDANSFVFPRRRLGSLREMFELVRTVLDRAGYGVGDLALLQQKLFVYLTSCAERRRDYESLSWWEFMDGDAFSERFQKHLETAPQLLVGMAATRGDARTIGDVAVQLLMDQLDPGRRTDGTLKGPTSLAWLDHWRAYLEHQGVHFVRGALAALRLLPVPDGAGGRREEIVPFVDVHEDPFLASTAGAHARGGGEGERGRPVRVPVLFDYSVVAVPPEVLKELVSDLVRDADRRRAADGPGPGSTERAAPAGGDPRGILARLPAEHPLRHGDLAAILELDFDEADARSASVRGDFDHLSGIQLYFETDVRFVRGHTIYADSAWGLSSIGQPQFWTRRRGPWDGYRGILSVDLGNLHQPDAPPEGELPRRAWDCTPQELARRTWRQITGTSRHPERIPHPWFYHVDDNLEFDERGIRKNRSMFLVNRPGRYAGRPGRPGRYELVAGRLVFAGTFMQTWTRMTTMEAANESARHAVNAILEQERKIRTPRGEPCGVWPPIRYEPPELRTLRELDELLWREGLPHLFDILGLDRLPDEWLSGASLADVEAMLPGWLRGRMGGGAVSVRAAR